MIIGDDLSTPKLRQATEARIVTLDDLFHLGHDASFVTPPKSEPKSEVFLMTLTSGSTGPSKAIRMSHYNAVANMIQFNTCFIRLLLYNPLTHLSGLLCFLAALNAGETVFIAPEGLKNDFEKFLETCAKYKPETCLTMPVMLNKLTKNPSLNKVKSLKRCFTGGSSISQNSINEFLSLYPGIQVENLFGSSEAGVLLRNTDHHNFQRLGVSPNVQFKIVDLNTNEVLGPMKPGMLLAKAPSVTLGYLDNEKAQAEAYQNGWQITGDVAYRDDQGFLVIVDRVKQLIKCLDTQVAPADLEDLLVKDHEVLRVIVCGLPHEKYGECAAAFVVPHPKANLQKLRKRLIEKVKSNLSFHKHLHGGLYFASSLPETESGKFSRKDMASMHLKNEITYLD